MTAMTPYAADMMPLTKEPLLEVSRENREAFMYGKEIQVEEDARNQRIFEERAFPLFTVIFILFILACMVVMWRKRAVWIRWMSDQWMKEVPPKEKLLQAIEKLHFSKQHEEQRYVALSNLIREYLETQLHFSAQEETTEELLQELADHPGLHPEGQKLLREFLSNADLVKFAHYQPTTNDWERAVTTAKQFARSQPG